MSLYAMHENAMQKRGRPGLKSHRVARTNSKIRKLVRRKDRRQGQRTKPDEE
jgi:hypothetical protein